VIFILIGYWGLNIGTGIFFQGQENFLPSEANLEYTLQTKAFLTMGIGGVYRNGLKIRNFECLAGKSISYKQMDITPLFGFQYFNIQYFNGVASGFIPAAAVEVLIKVLPDLPTIFFNIRLEEIFDGKIDVDIIHLGIGIWMQ